MERFKEACKRWKVKKSDFVLIVCVMLMEVKNLADDAREVHRRE